MLCHPIVDILQIHFVVLAHTKNEEERKGLSVVEWHLQRALVVSRHQVLVVHCISVTRKS